MRTQANRATAFLILSLAAMLAGPALAEQAEKRLGIRVVNVENATLAEEFEQRLSRASAEKKAALQKAHPCPRQQVGNGTCAAFRDDLVVVLADEDGAGDRDKLDALYVQKTPLVLFLNGREMTGLTSTISRENGRHIAHFHLVRNRANRDAWSTIFEATDTGTRTLRVSVGRQGGFPVLSESKAVVIFDLYQAAWWRVGVVAGALALVVVLFVILYARKQVRFIDLLREPLSIVKKNKDGPPLVPTTRVKGGFSLARTQMLFWTGVAVLSFAFIFIITGDYDTISTQTLILLGIAGATTLAATVIDVGAREREANEHRPEREALVKTWSDMEKTPVTDELKDLERQLFGGTGDFLADILSDANGLSVTRFQMLVWTLALGAVFVVEVCRIFTMPTFSENLLVLMGISGATYLGFKVPERQAK